MATTTWVTLRRDSVREHLFNLAIFDRGFGDFVLNWLVVASLFPVNIPPPQQRIT
jgi:hypothetical protein